MSSGSGLLNKLIDRLPFELHIPGYQFCGPGTRLTKRLARGDRGINALDRACLRHDRAYSRDANTAARRVADTRLAAEALARARAADAGLGKKNRGLDGRQSYEGQIQVGNGRPQEKSWSQETKKSCDKEKTESQDVKAGQARRVSTLTDAHIGRSWYPRKPHKRSLQRCSQRKFGRSGS